MYKKEELIKYPYFEKILQDRDISSVVDSLTGLISRSYIIGFIRHLIDNKVPFTLAMVDLDNFKYINDTQGHKIGDGVLAGFASDMKRYLSDYGIAGRFGGDEFLVINFRDLDYDSVKAFYSDMYSNYNVLRKNIVLDTCEPFVTGTIGSATYPKDATDYDSLFELIDKTLYRGKTKGRNCYIIYVESKHKNIQIKQLARRGLSAIFNDLSIRFDSSDTLMGKLEGIMGVMCDDMRIGGLYYQGTDTVVKKVGSDETFGTIDDLDKVVVNNIYSTNEIQEFMEKAPNLYNYCIEHDIFSIIIVRVGLTDVTYGYLMCLEPHSRRIWQDDEEAMMFFVARTLGGYIMITGEKL
ncbi:MAG: GGDEF domain-containing protein [Lachnospiraceae bacterium]|nr:GGDEF domain-containing protein [Lachnospiraceae bacterium]